MKIDLLTIKNLLQKQEVNTAFWPKPLIGAVHLSSRLQNISIQLVIGLNVHFHGEVRAGKGNPEDTAVMVSVEAGSLCKWCVCWLPSEWDVAKKERLEDDGWAVWVLATPHIPWGPAKLRDPTPRSCPPLLCSWILRSAARGWGCLGRTAGEIWLGNLSPDGNVRDCTRYERSWARDQF